VAGGEYCRRSARARGLVRKRRRRRTVLHPGAVPIRTVAPNDLWTADFKGQFRTRDGVYCYPLTIADQHTRFLLACHGLPSVKTVGARRVFERVFREYGLPNAIRTDNGVPSPATVCTASLSSTSGGSVWAFSTSASDRPHPTRTALMSACTRP
jgi:putative transposase